MESPRKSPQCIGQSQSSNSAEKTQLSTGQSQSSGSSEEEMDTMYFKVIKTVSFKVSRSIKIKSLKEILCKEKGFSGDLPELFFEGDELDDGQTLVDCRIKNNSTLDLFLHDKLFDMKVYINIPSKQNIVELKVKTFYTIQRIKFMIHDEERIDANQFSLYYVGKQLEDKMSLAFLDIKNESTLHLLFNPRDVLSIRVKTRTGNIVRVAVRVMHTVQEIKAVVGSMIGIPVSVLRLSFAGKELLEARTLAYYGIMAESMLEIILPPPLRISVVSLGGKSETLIMEQWETIEDLKEKIFQKFSHVPIDEQRLTYSDRRLREGENWHRVRGRLLWDGDMASNNIRNDSIIKVSFL